MHVPFRRPWRLSTLAHETSVIADQGRNCSLGLLKATITFSISRAARFSCAPSSRPVSALPWAKNLKTGGSVLFADGHHRMAASPGLFIERHQLFRLPCRPSLDHVRDVAGCILWRALRIWSSGETDGPASGSCCRQPTLPRRSPRRSGQPTPRADVAQSRAHDAESTIKREHQKAVLAGFLGERGSRRVCFHTRHLLHRPISVDELRIDDVEQSPRCWLKPIASAPAR